jgi:hypothetical protein
MGIPYVLAAHAVSSSSDGSPGGLFMLAWGIAATAAGLAAATNFRGFADAAAANSARARQPRWQRKPSLLTTPDRPDRPDQPNVGLVRLVGGVFAVVGPVMIVAGTVSSLHGHFAIPRTPPLPVPFRYAWLAFGAASIAFAWMPRVFTWRPRMGGYALSAARRNRWQRAASILATIGGAVFTVCTAYGRLTIGIAAWLASALIGLALFLVQQNPHHFVTTVHSDDPPLN